MTGKDEARLAPRDFMARRRGAAAASFEAVKPKLRDAAVQAVDTVVGGYGGHALQALRALDEDDGEGSSERWLMGLMALSVGHWIEPLEWAAGLITKKRTLVPTKNVSFVIDQASQAADPVALDVEARVYEAIKKGKAAPEDIVSPTGQTIPKQYIRLTVADGLAFISLVGLESLALAPAQFSGPIKVRLPSATNAAVMETLQIGTANTTVRAGPP